MPTKQNGISVNGPQRNIDRDERLIDMVKATAEVIGQMKPLSTDALIIIVSQLRLRDDKVIRHALDRCAREITTRSLSLNDILSRMGDVSEADTIDAAPFAAWDFVLNLRKYHLRPIAGASGEGQYELADGLVNDFSRYPGTTTLEQLMSAHFHATGRREVPARKIPLLRVSNRIIDSVRRSGGWARIAQMTPENENWVKRDFVEQYKAWEAVSMWEKLAEPEQLADPIKGLLSQLVGQNNSLKKS